MPVLHDRESWFTEAGANCNAVLCTTGGGEEPQRKAEWKPLILRVAIGLQGVFVEFGEMSLKMRYSRTDRTVGFKAGLIIAALSAPALLAGCQTSEVLHSGYIADQQSLDLVPVGASREQALLTLGTPSTTATFDNEVFYYISQKRTRSVAFQKPKLVEQNILAIYFNKDGVVEKRANYALQDGKVFDTISRTTPTGGKDLTFLQQLLSGVGSSASNAQAAKRMLGGN